MTTITIDRRPMSLVAAKAVTGTLGYPHKMPGTAYGISAEHCKTGAKLAQVSGSICNKCYAFNANYQYPSVKKAHAKRLAGTAHTLWRTAMVRMLKHIHSLDKNGKPRHGRNGPIIPGWHRWFDSGDLQSIDMLADICAICEATPNIWHWLPTKEGQMVKEFIANGGVIPENLIIRVSAVMIDGPAPQWWPWTSGCHHEQPAQGHDCPARFNQGRCPDSCRACWDRRVPHVSYPLH